MARGTMLLACSPNGWRRWVVEVALRQRFYYALIATIAVLIASGVQATADDGPLMIVGHDYVYYTVDHVPGAQGTLADVTSQLTTDHEGHVFDLYGSELVFSGADNYIRDVNSQIVGFAYVEDL
jgi:hypothetical protein